MVLEQLPADAGALTVLAAALAWALHELRARRQHHEEVAERRVEVERERLTILRAQAEAQNLQARALARMADTGDGEGLEIEQDLTRPGGPT